MRAGSHPDVRAVVPEGLSISVDEMRAVVGASARRPALGRWQVVVIEDADRLTERASNALLKAVEEPAPRTVFLLCAPSSHPDDVSVTIRSRCRLVALRTPPAAAVAAVLQRDGLDAATADWAAAAGQGHIGRSRRLVRDADARDRRAEVLAIPASLTTLRACLAAADHLVGAAEAEAAAMSGELDSDETEALQTALGAGGTGKGTATVARGMAGAIKDLERRQKSRATRTQRDALDRALVDLAAFYRDVLLVHSGSRVAPAHPDFADDVRAVALRVAPGRRAAAPGRRPGLPRGAGAERQAAHRGRGDDRRPPPALTTPPVVTFAPVADCAAERAGRARGGLGLPPWAWCAPSSFQRQGRLYYADPGELTPSVGEHVLYPTDAGAEVAEVMWAPQWVSDDIGGLPVLVGMAGRR